MEALALPELESSYTLSEAQNKAYQKNGHIRLNDMATREEVEAYREVVRGAVQQLNATVGPFREREEFYSKAFLQQMNLWEHDEAAKRFTLAKRFAKVAANLMGVDGVRIYHDHAVTKVPGGRQTPWHQDHDYWPLNNTCPMLTMWMPLVDVTAEMGSMVFAAESHRIGSIGELPLSDESEQVFKDYIGENSLRVVAAGDMKAGDATFHDGWTLHSTLENQTDRMREVMTVTYMADGFYVSRAVNDYQQDDLSRWLPGARPGDLVPPGSIRSSIRNSKGSHGVGRAPHEHSSERCRQRRKQAINPSGLFSKPEDIILHASQIIAETRPLFSLPNIFHEPFTRYIRIIKK